MQEQDPMQETVKAGFRVLGLVQGIGFRWWAKRIASRLALGGTVRNCPDGSVEVKVEGTSDAVAEMEQALRSGPPGAHVRDVRRFDVHEELPTEFQILLKI